VLRLFDGGASLVMVKSLLDAFFAPRCKLAGEHVPVNLTGAPLFLLESGLNDFGGIGSTLPGESSPRTSTACGDAAGACESPLARSNAAAASLDESTCVVRLFDGGASLEIDKSLLDAFLGPLFRM